MLNTRIEPTIHFQPHFFPECYLCYSLRVSVRRLIYHGDREWEVNKHCSSKSYPTVIQEGKGRSAFKHICKLFITSSCGPDHKKKLLVFTIIIINGFILLPGALSPTEASLCHRGGRLGGKEIESARLDCKTVCFFLQNQ